MKISREYLNKRYLLNTRRYATLAAALAAAGIGIVILVVVPQVQSVLNLVNDLQDAKKDTMALEQKVEQLRNLPQSDLLQASTTINNVLPSKKPLLELLTSYSQIAGEAGVQFSDVALNPGLIATQAATTSSSSKTSGTAAKTDPKKKAPTRRASSDYDQLDLSLKVSGSLGDINLFLQRVEQIAPMTTVTSMSLTEKIRPPSEPQLSDFYEAELVTTSYFFTQPVSATVRSPIPTLSSDQQQVITQISTFLIPEANEQTVITGGGLQDLFGLSDEDLL